MSFCNFSLATGFSLVCFFLVGCKPAPSPTAPTGSATNDSAVSNKVDSPKGVAPKLDANSDWVETKNYRFSLPRDYMKVEIPTAGLPPNLELAAWKLSANPEQWLSLVSLTIIDDANEARKAEKDPRQFLVNFGAGNAKGMGIRFSKQGATEKLDFGGMPFTKVPWSGTTMDQSPVNGVLFGATDGDKIIAIMLVDLRENSEESLKQLENQVATFSKL